MPAPRMHEDEVDTDPGLVRRLLGAQFPQWADLPVTPVASYGTDHAIYRLGRDLAVRLPRIGWAVAQGAKEAQWLPRLAPRLPMAVPAPVALGEPALGYPFPWAVHEWFPGTDATAGIGDPEQAAVDLAGFVRALRAVDTTGAPTRAPGARGGPLAEHDDGVRQAVELLGDRIDGPAALRGWAEAVDAPAEDGPEVWLHGDLLPGNLLVVDGRITAVIDWGGLAGGDPACDLQPAWHLFTGATRGTFLAALGTDDATRLRGRGWVLAQALVALPYYWDTNPGIVRQSLRALDLALSDAGVSGRRGG